MVPGHFLVHKKKEMNNVIRLNKKAACMDMQMSHMYNYLEKMFGERERE
jgi:hypothetical protein